MAIADFQPIIHTLFTAVLAIIAITNPFGNLPQFISMTEGMPGQTRQKLFRYIVLTAFIIVLLFTFTGPYIMKYLFQIEIRDLRMGGGIILIIIGIKNLLFPLSIKYQAPTTGEESEDEIIRKSIIPMAFPMMVGPGTLATMIVISTDDGMIITIFSAAIAFLFMLILFHFAASIERMLGKLVLHVFARILQVFIVAIGVKMIMTGIKESLQYLAQ